ncbi:DUF1488 domain-containing protein [Vibrio hepatarius]|uniref:DUF1488 domain-containing protein n=1 Tax=Vibrio hepatarius TaxID=171383 RepID=UPI001C085434|nr:DUF1488 domain-containing protein [Vibrio hepatarius]MBU2897640.1 DUF1488 domain-containing protein [Vibrio hepatarius]
MNQSILFSDTQLWDKDKQAVFFSAQCSGALIQCLIRKKELESIAGYSLNDEQQILEAFSMLRFDVEELTEQLIEDEAFNEQGMVEVVS